MAAWAILGSAGAFADDQGQSAASWNEAPSTATPVQQTNDNTSTTVINNSGAQSNGIISGPVVVPVNLAVGLNGAGPINLLGLSSQTESGNAPGGIEQTNTNGSTTIINNEGASSNGVVSGPIVVPVTGGVHLNLAGPINGNVASDQTDSGDVGGLGVIQLNRNTSETLIDNRGASSSGVVSGPIVIPVTLGAQGNAAGPVNGNVASNQTNSGDNLGGVVQANENGSTTIIDNTGATSRGVIAGPLVVPVTGAIGLNLAGPVNANAVSSQANSGDVGLPVDDGVTQCNHNLSTVAIDNTMASSTGVVAGPTVVPVTAGAQANVEGPLNANAASSQIDSGFSEPGSQSNVNTNSVDLVNEGASSSGVIAGPTVLAYSAGYQANASGPVNVNALSDQLRSGRGGAASQSNLAANFINVDNTGAQSAGAVAGPTIVSINNSIPCPVACVSPSSLNVAGPVNVNGLGSQDSSGNSAWGTQQSNIDGNFVNLANAGASSVGAVAGPDVIELNRVTVGAGLFVISSIDGNFAGPINAGALSGQTQSGNGGPDSQTNLSGNFLWADNRDDQSMGVVAGPVVVPFNDVTLCAVLWFCTGPITFNHAGPLNVNAASSSADSQNAPANSQSDVSGNWVWLDNAGAVASGGVAGPVVLPVNHFFGCAAEHIEEGPCIGDISGNLDDATNVNGLSSQARSGNGGASLQWTESTNYVWINNQRGSESGVVAGPTVVELNGVWAAESCSEENPPFAANLTGPCNVNLLSSQVASGNAPWSTLQINRHANVALIDNRDASTAGVVAGPDVVQANFAVSGNAAGPVNANGLGDQLDSGNAGHVTQVNLAENVTGIDDRGASAVGGVAGPVAVPLQAAVQPNVAGPVNVNGASGQQLSGNMLTLEQHNIARTAVDIVNDDATASGVVPGPIVVPGSAAAGANVAGPANVNGLGDQVDSGDTGVTFPLPPFTTV